MTQLRDLVRRAPGRGLEFPPRLERIVSVGIVASEAQVVRRQRCVNIGAFATMASAFSHLVFNALHDFHGLFIVNVYNAILIGGALLVPRLHRYGEHAGAIALILLVVFTHTLIVWAFGLDSGLQTYFTLGGAVLFFFGVQNWRLFLVYFGLFGIALLDVLAFAPAAGLVAPEDRAFRSVLSSQAMINTMIINAALLFYALAALQRAEAELRDEHARSEALIEAVMPQPIAARLKSGQEERIADRIETLAMLFADLVGFTAAAHDLAPEEVVDFLDRQVRMLDELAAAHGVEKIKTIGDCYMAAAGFDGNAGPAAVALGRFALAMLAAVERLEPLAGRRLTMRVGLHCGAATAGVIGATRFSYDVWGDAVNVASRMESHGVPGRIHVSEAYRTLTGDAFVFEERGATDLKGLGTARTFFLLGEKA